MPCSRDAVFDEAWPISSLLVLAITATAACFSGADEGKETARTIDTIAPDDWNPTLALVDGDAVYAPRLTRLDVHLADGSFRTVRPWLARIPKPRE